MSAACKLPRFLQTEVINTANHLVNISPTRANHGITPEQRFTKTKPGVDNLKIFGVIAYLHIPRESRSKLDSKTLRCLFVGYDEHSKAYRVFDPVKRKLYISRDVVIDESQIGYVKINPQDGKLEELALFPNQEPRETKNDEQIELPATQCSSDNAPPLSSSTDQFTGYNDDDGDSLSHQKRPQHLHADSGTYIKPTEGTKIPNTRKEAKQQVQRQLPTDSRNRRI